MFQLSALAVPPRVGGGGPPSPRWILGPLVGYGLVRRFLGLSLVFRRAHATIQL